MVPRYALARLNIFDRLHGSLLYAINVTVSMPVCFRFSQPSFDYKQSEDFFAYCLSVFVVQIYEAWLTVEAKISEAFGGIIAYFQR